jgi:23S rRNA (guanosine2251-2'-O)-methyltransferase
VRLVAGLQPVREAIRVHGAKLEKVVVEIMRPPSPQLEALARYAGDHGASVERKARAELDRLAQGAKHQGAVAMAPELRVLALDDLDLSGTPLVVALDEVQDPQNFGAIIRSAVAMGATAVMWPEHRAAPLTMATFRASAGAVEHARLCRVSSLAPALERMKEAGLTVVGLDAAGTSGIDAVDLAGPLVLVVGAEGKGLRKTTKRVCDALARLPMPGPIASLNASVASAIALYEVVRQRATRSALSRGGGGGAPAG